MCYLMGFDEDFAKKAQVHIFDWAKNKREKRIAHRAAAKIRMKAAWDKKTEAQKDIVRKRVREQSAERRRKRTPA